MNIIMLKNSIFWGTRFLMIFSLLFLCTCTNKGQKVAADYGNIASVPAGIVFNDSVFSHLSVNSDLNRKAPKLIYYFNGDCSSCIAAFFRFFVDWQQFETIIPAYFIASAPHLDILNYYMEQANISPPQSSLQTLLLDSTDILKKYNPNLSDVISNIYVLLLDENNNVVESRNPFIDKDAMRKYKQINLDYKSDYRPVAIPQQAESKQPELLDIINRKIPPLIIINDKSSSVDMLKSVRGNITSWSFVDGASAVILYGNKGKNGVLNVSTK